jgi:hypothetical protein
MGKTNIKILPKPSVDFHDKAYFNIMDIILMYSGRTGGDHEREFCAVVSVCYDNGILN